MFHQARSLLYDGALVFREPFLWQTVYHTSLYGIGQSLVYLPTLALFSGLNRSYSIRPQMVDFRKIYLDVVRPPRRRRSGRVTAAAAHRVAALGRAGAGRAHRWGPFCTARLRPSPARSTSQPGPRVRGGRADRVVRFAQTREPISSSPAAIAFSLDAASRRRPAAAFRGLVCLAFGQKHRSQRASSESRWSIRLACDPLLNAVHGAFHTTSTLGALVAPDRASGPLIWLGAVAGLPAICWPGRPLRSGKHIASRGGSSAFRALLRPGLARGGWRLLGPRRCHCAVVAVLAAAGLAELPRRWRAWRAGRFSSPVDHAARRRDGSSPATAPDRGSAGSFALRTATADGVVLDHPFARSCST
jgi:hypothetical protein